jgi:hypothetical protein
MFPNMTKSPDWPTNFGFCVVVQTDHLRKIGSGLKRHCYEGKTIRV